MLVVSKTLNQNIQEPHPAPLAFLAHHLVSHLNRDQYHTHLEALHQKKASQDKTEL